MRYTWALAILLLLAPAGAPAQKKKKSPPSNTQVLTGCIDEKPEVYILRTEDALKEIAQLEPVGFEKQIFARYVGHKVTIAGELLTTTTPPTLRVKSPAAVKEIAEICAPH